MAAATRIRWFWLSLGIVVADRATKLAIEQHTPEGFHRTIIPRVIYLVHSHNPGIAFGIFAEAESKWLRALLIATSIVVIGILSWLLATGRAGGLPRPVRLALTLGGAAGDLIDRRLPGNVTDIF